MICRAKVQKRLVARVEQRVGTIASDWFLNEYGILRITKLIGLLEFYVYYVYNANVYNAPPIISICISKIHKITRKVRKQLKFIQIYSWVPPILISFRWPCNIPPRLFNSIRPCTQLRLVPYWITCTPL